MQTSDYLVQLQNDKETLVDNLVEKGVSATSDETFTTLVPKVLDISGGVDINEYFKTSGFSNSSSSNYLWANAIKKIPDIDITGVTDLSYGFYNYKGSVIPKIRPNTSSVTNMNNMFSGCTNLTTIPELDTSNATNFQQFAFDCSKLTTIPELDFSKATNINNFMPFMGKLTSIGGFKNLGMAYLTTVSENYYAYDAFVRADTITHDSLMNIINDLYDIKTKGCNAQRLVLSSASLKLLTNEEIAIATNKGWNVVV